MLGLSLSHKAIAAIDDRLTAAHANIRLAEESLSPLEGQGLPRSYALERVSGYLDSTLRALGEVSRVDSSFASSKDSIETARKLCMLLQAEFSPETSSKLESLIEQERAKLHDSLLTVQSAGIDKDGMPGRRYVDLKFERVKRGLSESFVHYRPILEDIAYLHSFGVSGITQGILTEAMETRRNPRERCSTQPRGFDLDVALFDLERLNLIERSQETMHLPYQEGEYKLTPLGRALLAESR